MNEKMKHHAVSVEILPISALKKEYVTSDYVMFYGRFKLAINPREPHYWTKRDWWIARLHNKNEGGEVNIYDFKVDEIRQLIVEREVTHFCKTLPSPIGVAVDDIGKY